MPFMVEAASCATLGCTVTPSDPLQATCTAARGPFQGMLEQMSAAETAFIAKLLAGAVPSEHSMLTVTCMHPAPYFSGCI